MSAALAALPGAGESEPSADPALAPVESVDCVLLDGARGSAARVRRPSARGRRAEEIAALAARRGIPLREVGAGECDRLSGVRSQGIAAAIRYRYADFAAAVRLTDGPIVFLDGIEDPHNLGAVIRTAAAVGAGAVVIPKHRAAGVTAAVMRASAGTAVSVPVCRVTNLVRAIGDARHAGCWVTGLDAAGAGLLGPGEAGRRAALVVGGEGRGLRPLVARSCDEIARLPMAGGVESLNASTAAAVALYRLCETTLFRP